VPYLSDSAVVIHYEEALYQVYAPLPYLTVTRRLSGYQTAVWLQYLVLRVRVVQKITYLGG